MPKPLTAAIIVPTHRRPGYLDRALATIVPQAREHNAEVIVVDDAGDAQTRAVAQRHGARLLERQGRPGLNAARNTAIAATNCDLLCFVDDDVEVCAGWLAALIGAAWELPSGVGVLTGPIRARFDDHRFRACGRERAPITELDLGAADRDTERAWGANMAIRRSAIERIGGFDEWLPLYGDEEQWQQRWLDAGGRIRYVAAAAIEHVRRGDDARLRALCRSAYHRGRAARAYDHSRGVRRPLSDELRTLAGSAWHGPRRLCFNGPVLVAHSLGRIAEALSPRPAPARPRVDDFLSGRSGTVGGRRDALRRAADAWLDARTLVLRTRLRRAARELPERRRILVAGIERTDVPSTSAAIRAELARSRHELVVDIRPMTPGGKFENVNAILAGHELAEFDYVLVIDDDIDVPRGFIDLLVHCAHVGDLAIAQPAHRRRSHAGWEVARRTAAAWRETTFVEIGPATLFDRRTVGVLLPFPEGLRMGWGLDAHWAAVARARGWRLGIVDAAAVGHTLRPIAADYPRDAAIDEARSFLAGRDYVTRDEVRTLATHR